MVQNVPKCTQMGQLEYCTIKSDSQGVMTCAVLQFSRNAEFMMNALWKFSKSILWPLFARISIDTVTLTDIIIGYAAINLH
jgi:hypothetical protein